MMTNSVALNQNFAGQISISTLNGISTDLTCRLCLFYLSDLRSSLRSPLDSGARSHLIGRRNTVNHID